MKLVSSAYHLMFINEMNSVGKHGNPKGLHIKWPRYDAIMYTKNDI